MVAAVSKRWAAFAAAVLALAALARPCAADEASARVLDTSVLRVLSAGMRVTAFVQDGHGYQSQAGGGLGPGSEHAHIFEPQLEIVMAHGERLTHRLWVPVDMVTAASPNSIAPPDMTSGASRRVEGGTVAWTGTYRASRVLDVSMTEAMRVEQPLRSWTSGVGFRRSFADEATVLSASTLEVYDWFDRFDIHGRRYGHADRNGTTGSVSLTQVLTPTTVANVNYGVTVLEGVLGNTWNSVPLASGVRGAELLPNERVRHALVLRASQWLPWNGALRFYYRFYADDWGLVASSVEGQLSQRLAPQLYVTGYYRFHTQTGVSFFTTRAPVDATLRVADSDLAPLDSHTVGGRIALDLPVTGRVRAVHLEVGVERYVRTNDLQMDNVTCASGFLF